MSWPRRPRQRAQACEELRAEIAEHLHERSEALQAQGLSPADAARQARLAFGDPQVVLERGVLVWHWAWLHSVWFDLRLAARRLRRSPGYALTAVLTLAVGIGANAAVFAVIDDAMLRSLPVQDPSRLVMIGYRNQATGRFADVQIGPVFQNLRRNLREVQGLSGWSGSMITFPDDQKTLRSIGADLVTGNAFQTLGVRPFLGRLLSPQDDVPGGPEGGWPAVLNYGFWLSNFRGDPSIVGTHLLISGQPAVIVGVLPPSFFGLFVGQPQRVFLPLHFLSALATSPEQDPFLHPERLGVQTMARLAPGASLRSLNAQLAARSPALRSLLPPALLTRPFFRDSVLAARDGAHGFSILQRDYLQPLLLIQGIALAVLLLCCLNLAGLQTARLHAHRRDAALRIALGAGRARVLQSSLLECFLLAIGGGTLAAALAWFSISALCASFTPAGFDQPLSLRPDWHTLAIAGALALGTTLLFGLAPAFVALREEPRQLLQSGGGALISRHGRWRQWLWIPAQFALALALVFSAGLFTHTLLRLRGGHLGFQPAGVTCVTAQFQRVKGSADQIMLLYRQMVGSLRESPGIHSAAYAWYTPLTGDAAHLTAHALAPGAPDRSVAWNDVSDGYFATVGTQLLTGRAFTPQDRDRSVCVLNQAASRLLFGRQTALGSVLVTRNTQDNAAPFSASCRVVGIVEDALYASLEEAAPPTVYFPAAANTVASGGYANNLVFFMRSGTEAEATSAYRAALRRYAPNTGYMVFFTLQHELDQAAGSQRLIAGLAIAFGALALLLSGIGLFGVMALRVGQRRAEIGIRLAIGASRQHIVALVLREAFTLVGVGVAGGVLLAALVSALVRHFLYQTSPFAPGLFAGALALLLAAGLAATLLPARRAATFDPARVLRSE